MGGTWRVNRVRESERGHIEIREIAKWMGVEFCASVTKKKKEGAEWNTRTKKRPPALGLLLDESTVTLFIRTWLITNADVHPMQMYIQCRCTSNVAGHCSISANYPLGPSLLSIFCDKQINGKGDIDCVSSSSIMLHGQPN